jgi:hypothetical protein
MHTTTSTRACTVDSKKFSVNDDPNAKVCNNLMMMPRRPSLRSILVAGGAGATASRAVQLFVVFVLSSTIAEQFYISFYTIGLNQSPNHPGLSQVPDYLSTSANASEADILSSSSPYHFDTNANTNNDNDKINIDKNSSFGACLMIKEDNELLPEWLAYHYTVLPLRYIVIGSDVGNTQNPEAILSRWKTAHTDLQYWVWNNASTFVHRHDPMKVKHADKSNDNDNHSNSIEDKKLQAHHAFVHRQKGFITTCSEFLKKQGVQWTTYIDSDEFVVLNRLGPDDKDLIIKDSGPNSIRNESYQARRDLDSAPGSITGAEVLHKLRDTGYLEKPCYTLPRLLVGALENATCPDAAAVNELARRDYRYDEMSTLRFVQHAKKGDFSASKFGKVVMDLSEIDEETVNSTVPRNIHRPYKSVCGPAVVPFPNAVLYLNHYIGTWERYNSRQDGRRNRQEWQQRAYFDEGASCDNFEWFPRFIAQMGKRRAQFLLGVVDDVNANVDFDDGTDTTS